MDDFKLWGDLTTDADRVDFLRSGRAWKTGIIAESIVEDVADAFEFRMKVQQSNTADLGCWHEHLVYVHPNTFCAECGVKLPNR